MTISLSIDPERTLSLSSNLDDGVGWRAAIGLIVLASDQTIEHEFRHLLGIDGVALYQSRILNDSCITSATLRAMQSRISDATALMVPGLPLDVVAFGCTSASMVIGEQEVFQQIKAVQPDITCTTPITAAFAALDALRAKRIALLTPYCDDVNQTIRAYIEARGVKVATMGSFHEKDDRRACRISAASIRDAAITLGRTPDIDAVFVSCTNLRVARVVAAIEAAIGKPVTSSNHALAWHCLRLAGIDDRRDDIGRLFQLDLTKKSRT